MPRLFVLLGQLPTQAILFVFAVVITAATAGVVLWRVARGEPTGDLGEWLLFCGALLGIERAGYVGKRQTTWKPTEVASAQVIAAQAPPAEVTSGPPSASVLPVDPDRSPPARVGPLTPLTPPGGRIEDDPNFHAHAEGIL